MEYLIKEDKHYSKGVKLIWRKNVRTLTFNFRFNKFCWYDIKTFGDHTNKLFGVSKRFLPKIKDREIVSGHHYNSIRIGWRPATVKGKIDLFVYLYNKGEREIIFLDKVDIDSVYNAEFTFTDDLFMLKTKSIVGQTRSLYSKQITWAQDMFNYMLFPYYGGDPVCPWDMTIYITHLTTT